MFDKPSFPEQSVQLEIHWVGTQASAVVFLVKAMPRPPSREYEATGVQLSVQLTGGVYTVVKGVGVQLLSQNS